MCKPLVNGATPWIESTKWFWPILIIDAGQHLKTTPTSINNMSTTTTLSKPIVTNILGTDFDICQLHDIATHGMAQGVAGFIYSTELAERFEANEEEILNVLDELAFDLGERCGLNMVINAIIRKRGNDFYTTQDVKEIAVWMFVEHKAFNALHEAGHPDWV